MDSGMINEKVRTLAATLRSNGLAASDTQALDMAKNMVQTDKKVMQQAEQNKSSMIKNYDVSKPAARVEDPFAEQEKQKAQSWEKEESAQAAPVSEQGPASSTNQALDDAISNVQQQFSQPTQNNPELPPHVTLEEASQAPEQVFDQAPQHMPTQPIVEEPQVQEQAPVMEEQATPVVEQPQQSIVENTVAPQEEIPAMPAEQPVPATKQAQQVEEDTQVEQTQELPTTPQRPVRDTSNMAESKIQLSDVFNVNK